MGVPIPPQPHLQHQHAFVRIDGTLADLDGLDVTACSHYGIDGELVTEALVCGEDAMRRLEKHGPVPVSHPEWVRQSILAASGSEASQGMLAVLALRAPEDEWHLVSHPRAPSAVALLAQLSSLFDRWLT